MKVQLSPASEINPEGLNDLQLPAEVEPLEDLSIEEDPFATPQAEDGTQVAGPWAKILKSSVKKFQATSKGAKAAAKKFQVDKTTETIRAGGDRGRAPDIPMDELEQTAGSFHPPNDPLEPRTTTRNLNIDHFDAPEDIINAIDEMATAQGGFMEARRGVRTHEETIAASRDEIVKITGMKPQDGWTGERILAARELLSSQATRLQKKAANLNDPAFNASEEDWAEFARAQGNFVTTQRLVSGATAEKKRIGNYL